MTSTRTLAILLGACLALACGPAGEAPIAEATAPDPDEIAIIRMVDGGQIRIRFFADVAPAHVVNFKKLARRGYYDGTTFHRVIPDFMIQGGDELSKDDDPLNDGTGSPGYSLEAEFSDIPHRRGIVAMGRRSDPDSAGSQFYIMVADRPQWREVLDGKYTVFGEVIGGMAVADRIVATPRDVRDRPLRDQVVETVMIRPAAEQPE